MKKAVANVTVKIDRVIYQKGTVFTEPFPPGVQKEIDAGTGTVSEFDEHLKQAEAIEMSHRQPGSAKPGEFVGKEAIKPESEDAELDELFGEDMYAEPEPEAPEMVAADESPEAPELEVELIEVPVESNAAKRTRLIREAQERFGVKIDKRKSLAQVEAMIIDLIANLPELPNTDDSTLPDLSEI